MGKRRPTELVQAAAVGIAAYYAAKIPTPRTREMPLVVQIDGTGVVMRPEATRRAAAKTAAAGRRGRLAPGEKLHRIIHPPGGRSELRTPRPGPTAQRKWCTPRWSARPSR